MLYFPTILLSGIFMRLKDGVLWERSLSKWRIEMLYEIKVFKFFGNKRKVIHSMEKGGEDDDWNRYEIGRN